MTDTMASERISAISPSGRTRAWLGKSWPYLLIAVLAIGSSALHVARVTEISPIDETRNLDYMLRIYDDGHIVKLGDRIDQKAMRFEACRGLDFELPTPNPPCTSRRFESRDFRDDGFNNAVNHPPGYHLVTGAFAKATTLLGISNSELDPARIFGGLWLALGLMLALFAGELLAIPRVPLVAAVAIFALAPDVLNSAAIVNADGASVFAGGLVLVAALLWERGRLPMWCLALAGAAVAALKLTNLVVIVIIVLWFLSQAYRQRQGAEPDRPLPRRYVVACCVLMGAAVVVSVVWLAIVGARATIDPLRLGSNQMFYTENFPARVFFESNNLFSFFPAGGPAYRAPVLMVPTVIDVSIVSGWLCVVALVGNGLRFSVRDRLSTLGAWAALVLVVAGPAFIFGTWLTSKVTFAPSPRYALSAIPIVIVLLASLVRGRTATIAICFWAVISTVTILGALVFG